MNQAATLFHTVLKKKSRIKLLGDSITHGVGGTGFEQNGEPIVTNFFRNPDGYCWAKQWKEYLEAHYACEVVNNACTGTTIQFILEHFDTLVDEEDDLILCTIGTNNRHQYHDQKPKHTREEHMEEFYQNILALHERFQKANKSAVFMANIPASSENEQDGENYWRLFHMEDVYHLYQKASEVCGFPLIEMYRLFSEYCEQNNVTVDSLLADGLHPTDQGYDVMYQLIMKELELL
ncbi:MAG: SGNH/GDSL hydrolase family protein [Ruminococcaceae bacterium]|nr:SGNH/GDSL hydrolase family protein [Oscillospiraceae bacterium]